jgi:indole-3-glycerol phosphate synthase
MALICEYKRASPSKGDIELSLGPEEASQAYGRADCLSVLTEEALFKGSLSYLWRMGPQPLLRKDFLSHPLQAEETALTPASAILLILRLFRDLPSAASFFDRSVSLGLEPVVEVFTPRELDMARSFGATLIQVNARDLATLTLDKDLGPRLIGERPPKVGEFFIAASGIGSAGDLRKLRDAGYGAALIGTSLMSGGKPKERLDALLEGLGDTGEHGGA